MGIEGSRMDQKRAAVDEGDAPIGVAREVIRGYQREVSGGRGVVATKVAGILVALTALGIGIKQHNADANGDTGGTCDTAEMEQVYPVE